MRRIVSLYLPTWPTDRIRRRAGKPPRHEPLVTVHIIGMRRVVRCACAAAQEANLYAGMALAEAKALVPKLHVVEAAPDEDEASLRELARWVIVYSPIVAVDPPDGLWIDIACVAHLFGSEEELLADLTCRLTRQGIAAKAAVADAPGTAWAVARYGAGGVVSTRRTVDAIATLPIRALRISAEKIGALQRLGIERVGQLGAMPRAPLVRRFGRDVALRLDQALGHAFEPVMPMIPKEVARASLAFAQPIGELDDLKGAVRRLTKDLCWQLERRGKAPRRLDLLCLGSDQKASGLRAAASDTVRDASQIARLFDDQLQALDSGLRIEELVLVASQSEALAEMPVDPSQAPDGPLEEIGIDDAEHHGLSRGSRRLYRLPPVQRRAPKLKTPGTAATVPGDAAWPKDLPRPTRLLEPPEPVIATALLPDHPPAFFVWRKVRHRVIRADGPKRVAPAQENCRRAPAARDYFEVESEQGTRFWLFRDAPTAEGGHWWMHGFFA